MELYLNVLKLFILNKEVFNNYKDVVDKEFLRDNYPELLRIFNILEDLHQRLVETSLVDAEMLLLAAYPAADKSLYKNIFASISKADAHEASIVEYLRSLKDRQEASKLAFLALDVAEGKASKEALTTLIGTWQQAQDAVAASDELQFVSDDIEVLYQHAVAEGGLRWPLKSLNRSLGPLRKGDFGFIFARPETGKTTFLSHAMSYMAQHAEGPCLWFNNEEQGEKVGIRLYQSTLGAPLERIVANRPAARAAYLKRTAGRIRLVDNATLDRAGIEKYCRRTSPSLVVIDQLDKVKGFDGDREDLRMGAIYQWARELSKAYCPVIGVSQSDGSGEGVKYLHMNNVANAKTSKQAEADWILGIGFDYSEHPQVRGLSICKNKLIGGEESVPKLRHAHWDVLILPEIGRYKDMGEEEDEDEDVS